MEDKEVGVRWREAQDHLGWPEPLACDKHIVALIRKLVEERAVIIQLESPSMPAEFAEKAALRQFGIEPKDF